MKRHTKTKFASEVRELAVHVALDRKGYDSGAFLQDIASRCIEAVIAMKRNRKRRHAIDGFFYAPRILAECCLAEPKSGRRLAA